MSDCCIVCPLCGFHECGSNTCPRCGVVVIEGRVYQADGKHRHYWEGLTLVCEGQGTVQRATMDSLSAREIPYCPYCQEALRVRPSKIEQPIN